MKTRLLLTALTLLFVVASQAQDLIYKKNEEVIVARVLEIGLNEIRYKEYNNPEGPVISIARELVLRVKYENGKTMLMRDAKEEYFNTAAQRKNIIKVDFFAPMAGQTTLAYERKLKPDQSVEFQLGIIGWGTQNYKPENNTGSYNYPTSGATASGAFVRVGYKFNFQNDMGWRGLLFSRVLEGMYFKPEITLGACNEKLTLVTGYSSSGSSALTETIKKPVQFGALMLCFGQQNEFGNLIVIDYFIGLGYGFSSKAKSSVYQDHNLAFYASNNHAFMGPAPDGLLAVSAGLKLGLLID